MRGKTADEVLEWAQKNGHFGLKTSSGIAAIELGGTWGNIRYGLQSEYVHALFANCSSEGIIDLQSLTVEERRLLASRFFHSPPHCEALLQGQVGEIELFLTQSMTIRLAGRDLLLIVTDSDQPQLPAPVSTFKAESKRIQPHTSWFLSKLEDPEHSFHTFDLPFVRSQYDGIEEALLALKTRIACLREQIREEEAAVVERIATAHRVNILPVPEFANFSMLPPSFRRSIAGFVSESAEEFGFYSETEALRALEKAPIQESNIVVMMSVRTSNGVELRVEAFRWPVSSLKHLIFRRQFSLAAK